MSCLKRFGFNHPIEHVTTIPTAYIGHMKVDVACESLEILQEN